MDKQLSQTDLFEFLKHNSNIVPKFCDNCGNRHKPEDLQVIGQKNNNISCRIFCDNCGSTQLMNIGMPVGGVGVATRAPINVDLTSADEFNKFAGKSAVTDDDAIDSYKQLEGIKNLRDFIAKTQA